MTDNLRARIAAAIYNASDEYTRKLMVRPDCPGASELGGDSKPVCYTLADAVIAELYPQRQCHICGRSGTQQFVACDSGWVCRSVFACEVRRLNG